MKYIIPFLFLFISCKSKSSTNHSDSVTQTTPKEFDISYDSVKHNIQIERNSLKYKDITAEATAKEESVATTGSEALVVVAESSLCEQAIKENAHNMQAKNFFIIKHLSKIEKNL